MQPESITKQELEKRRAHLHAYWTEVAVYYFNEAGEEKAKKFLVDTALLKYKFHDEGADLTELRKRLNQCKDTKWSGQDEVFQGSKVTSFNEILDRTTNTPILSRLIGILDGSDDYIPYKEQTQGTPKPPKIEPTTQQHSTTKPVNWFNRSRELKAYFTDNPLSEPATADQLVKWLKEFYCPRYLQAQKGGAEKAGAILKFIEQNPPTGDMSANEYSTRVITKSAGTTTQMFTRTLMKLVGQHRAASFFKSNTWGLDVMKKHFNCTVEKEDIYTKNDKRGDVPIPPSKSK